MWYLGFAEENGEVFEDDDASFFKKSSPKGTPLINDERGAFFYVQRKS